MTENIESGLNETRLFPPSDAFVAQANVSGMDEYKRLCAEAEQDPERFWGTIAKELHWFKPWDTTLIWHPPFAQWFAGGKTNISYNCIDRHIQAGLGTKPAIIWEGEPGDERTLTYDDLHREVCTFANVLKNDCGLQSGDTVTLYMPMIPELTIAMLACARIGAPHSIIFGGFSADAIRDRVQDAKSKVIITADGGWRRGSIVPLKDNIDNAIQHIDLVEKVIVYQRTQNKINMQEGRDYWWHDLVGSAQVECPAAELDSEHPLYILYTSGTTGKPKGIMHTTGGYMTQTYITSKWVFDLKQDDVYWCTADIGWVTGHSYIVYGPLANGASVVMYEGAPNHPDEGRFWSIVQKYNVSILYTAPTAIRAFMKWGNAWPEQYDLSSLRLLGSVGEPINPEAWMWYHTVIGNNRCPIVDTWWQTETGSILITPLPGVTPTKPGSASLPFPGIKPTIVSREGNEVAANEGGFLIITHPWPSMLRTIYGDDERYQSQYWSQVEGKYFTGDGARCDDDGYYWIMGRIDDVIKVAGHRLGTMEVESALVSHDAVVEAAVVGRPDDLKGEAIVAFATTSEGHVPDDALKAELRAHVGKVLGAIAKPDDIRFTDALPKTRSGKIMRRLLREIASGSTTTGDTTTLEDLSVLASLRGDDG